MWIRGERRVIKMEVSVHGSFSVTDTAGFLMKHLSPNCKRVKHVLRNTFRWSLRSNPVIFRETPPEKTLLVNKDAET